MKCTVTDKQGMSVPECLSKPFKDPRIKTQPKQFPEVEIPLYNDLTYHQTPQKLSQRKEVDFDVYIAWYLFDFTMN